MKCALPNLSLWVIQDWVIPFCPRRMNSNFDHLPSVMQVLQLQACTVAPVFEVLRSKLRAPCMLAKHFTDGNKVSERCPDTYNMTRPEIKVEVITLSQEVKLRISCMPWGLFFIIYLKGLVLGPGIYCTDGQISVNDKATELAKEKSSF